MKICFLGNSHLTICSIAAAARRSFEPVPQEEISSAELVVVAQDVTTNSDGVRYLNTINQYVAVAVETGLPVIVSSQIPPGYMRKLNNPLFFHHPETLRIKDASARALSPDYMALGCMNPLADIPEAVKRYVSVFSLNQVKVSYESAEFSKIAVNMMLAAQVDMTTRLAKAAEKCGASWADVSKILKLDKRIGPEAYLTPGRWQDSIHLLRDSVTLEEIERA